jgi:hypothetical protein
VPQASTDELDRQLRDLFAAQGPAPIRYVEYTGAADAVFDKLLMAYQATRRRWEFVGFPRGTRRIWHRRIVAAQAELAATVRRRGVLEYEGRTFRIFRFDVAAGDRGWATPLGDDATSVDLGAADSIRFKLHGFAASGPGPGDVPSAAIVGHADHAVRFTLRGLVDVPTGTTTVRAAVQLHVVPGDGAAVRVRVAGPVGGAVALAVNGVDLGKAPLTGGWQDITLPVPAAALEPERRLDLPTRSPDVLAVTVDGAPPGAVHVAAIASML